LRCLSHKAVAIGGALAALAIAAANLVSLPTTAGAAQTTIAPSGTIQGQPVHSGEGSPGITPAVVPLRVADVATYAREKQRASQLAIANTPPYAAGPRGPTSAWESLSPAAAAVFGSLNTAGLSAAQQIASFGEGADVTPPDTTGAIGPEDYVEFVNEEVAAYGRTNLAIAGSPVNLSTFTGGVAVCDPQIKYDPQSSRWFYAAIRCDGTTTANAFYLGFSKTSDPTNFSTAVGHGWCGYAYSTGKALEDYPKLGLDSLHIMIGANSFNAQTGAFLTAHILSLPKPASGKIETCPAAPKLTAFGSTAEPLRTSVGSHIASTPEPATVADESPSGFVVAADEATPFSGNGSHVMIWQVAGTAEKPELKVVGDPAVSEFKLPPNVPQPGSTDRLDSLDSRLTQAVAAADPGAGGAEAVWTQHTVAGGAGSVVRWYELLPGKLEVKQAGTISDPSNYVFNGGIAPTLSGGAVIDYDAASSTALVQIMAQSRVSSDPAGTMNTPIALASSAAIDSDFSCPSVEPKSIACRWGDYAGASVDPANSEVVWGSNQLNGPTGTGHRAQWATQNFAVTAKTLPAAPTVVTKAAAGVTQTSATLTATVNPNGGEVSECKFEYGTSTSYGSSVSCAKLPGAGTSPVEVSASVTGLAANTVYHFRIAATNAGGTSKGSDETFTTPANAPTVTKVEPSEGLEAGGTKVVITGADFTGATAVSFGTNPAKSFKVESATAIAAEAPTGTGTVDVTVTTAGGTSATSSGDHFTYVSTGGCDSWTNTAGGSWFTGTSWSKGSPPTSGEEACITAAGTYTVTMTQTMSTVSVKSLTIGGTSGTQTLVVGSSCSVNAVLSTTEGFSIGALGAVTMTDGELCGGSVALDGPIANAGTIRTEPGSGGARDLQGNLTNKGTLAIGTNSTFNGSGTTLVNQGAINPAGGVQLTVSNGSSVSNGSGGKISATGSGDIFMSPGTSFSEGAGTTSGTQPVFIDDATLSYTGAGASLIRLRGSSPLSGNLASGQSLSIESTCGENATASAGTSFTSAGTITLTNAESCGNNATLSLTGETRTLESKGTLNVENPHGGARAIEGNLANGGIVSLSAGETLKVTGSYTQASAGRLKTAIASSSSFGAMSVSGAATLAGKLALAPANAFKGSLGQTFAILVASPRTGTFSKETGGVIKGSLSGLYYEPTYSAIGVKLVVTQAKMAATPVEGAPGASVKLSGTGFPGGDKVKLAFTDQGGVKTTYASAVTNANGEFSAEVTVPAAAVVGAGKFTATSTLTGVVAMAVFTVT
jgi:hypothetical protein